MTSLLIKHANEIAESMAKTLGDENFTNLFKTASIEKAAGPTLEAFKKAIDMAVAAGTDLEQVWTKFLGSLQVEENIEPGTMDKARAYMAEKARTPGHRQPGQSFPQADDECMSADCMEGMMANDHETIAAEFVLNHLAKIADVLDGRGFDRLANIVDETMQKIASQKK